MTHSLTELLPPPQTPREVVPAEVSTGAWPAGPWLVGLCVLVAASALYSAARPDMFYVRGQLYGIAAVAGLGVVVVAAVWRSRSSRARAIWRDGALVDAVVAKSVEVRGRYGVVGHTVTVRFNGHDGRPREATFSGVRQVVVRPKVLVLGDGVGLWVPAMHGGTHMIPACFRVARARSAG